MGELGGFFGGCAMLKDSCKVAGAANKSEVHVICCAWDEVILGGLLVATELHQFGFVTKGAVEDAGITGEIRNTFNNTPGVAEGRGGWVTHALVPEFELPQ